MWLKTELMKYHNIKQPNKNTHNPNKTMNEILNKIVEKDLAKYYNKRTYYKSPINTTIDFDNNKIISFIDVKYFQHKSSNIHKLYKYLKENNNVFVLTNDTGKYKSFISALKNSYQAEWITLGKGTEKEARWRCVRPNRL